MLNTDAAAPAQEAPRVNAPVRNFRVRLLALVLVWGLGGAAYGLVVSVRMGLSGRAVNSLLLMAYLAVGYLIVGMFLVSLRAGVRALLRLARRAGEERPIPAAEALAASWGGLVFFNALLLACGDLVLGLTFRHDISRGWLFARGILELFSGAALWWLLAKLGARPLAGGLSRLHDRHGLVLTAGLLSLLLGLALLLSLAAPGGLRERGNRSGPPTRIDVAPTGLKVLLFGMDGLTWRLLDPLLDAGLMPTMARLLEQGAHTTVDSPPPQMSPVIWTTIVTGRPQAEHGIHEYLVVAMPGLDHFSYDSLGHDLVLVPFSVLLLGYYGAGLAEGIPPSSRQLLTKALWHMVHDGGGASLVLGWPCTWPAEPTRGLTLADRFGPGELDMFTRRRAEIPGLVYPPGSEAAVRPYQVASGGNPDGMLDRLGFPAGPEREELKQYTYNPMIPPPVRLLTDIYDADLTYLNVMEAQLRQDDYRLALIMLNGMDLTLHAFLPERFPEYFNLEHSRHPAWGAIIDAYHGLVDKRISAILEAAGPDTVVVMLSDHGMRPAPGNPVWPGWHSPEAIFVIAGGPVKRGIDAGQVSYFDITPTVLYLLGYPVPEDLRGRILTELIDEEFLKRFPVRRIPTYE